MIWLCEGMEEVGSPGLAEVIAEHRELLRADACLWESYYRSIDGRAAALGFGSRGVLNVELSVTLLDADQHSGPRRRLPLGGRASWSPRSPR